MNYKYFINSTYELSDHSTNH